MYQLKIILFAAILGYVLNEICRFDPEKNRQKRKDMQIPVWYLEGNDQLKWFDFPREKAYCGYSLTWENCNLPHINISLAWNDDNYYCNYPDIFINLTNCRTLVQTIDMGNICHNTWSICLILNNAQVTLPNITFSGGHDGSEIYLDLDNNFVNELHHDSWPKPYHIYRISLRNNSIRNIEVTSFSSLVNLRILDLSSNYIQSLSSNIFSNNTKLQDLRINDNRFKRISVADDFFQILPKILTYEFNETNFQYDIPLNSLINLKYFPDRATGDFTKRVSVIKQELFNDVNVTRIRNLNLKSLQVDEINQDAFLNFNTLKSLDLSDNHLSQLQNGDLDGLNNLQKLLLNYNRLEIIENDVFHDLNNLRRLCLSHNLFTNLRPKLLHHLTILISLDISHNLLNSNFSQNYDLFPNQKSLKILNLSFNQINQMNSKLTRSLGNLNELNLDHNLLTDQTFEFREILKPLRNLKRINYENNDFTTEYHLDLSQLCDFYHIRSFGRKDVRKQAVAENQRENDDLLTQVDNILMDYASYTDWLMYLSILQLIILTCFVSFSIFFPNHFKIFQYRG